jgi:hypothetical protein
MNLLSLSRSILCASTRPSTIPTGFLSQNTTAIARIAYVEGGKSELVSRKQNVFKWFKVLNPAYGHKRGRQEMFEAFGGEPRQSFVLARFPPPQWYSGGPAPKSLSLEECGT